MIKLYPQSLPATTSQRPDDEVSDEVVHHVMTTVGTEVRPGTTARPWVFANMISSADGATAVDGLSGGLGGAGDMSMFRALRSQADAILVGAATARAEQYRPPIAYEDAQEQRRQRGQRTRPRLALITNSLDIEPDLPMFGEHAENKPLIFTSEQSLASRGEALAEVATVVASGTDRVDLAAAVAYLGNSGHGRILCEGGPSVNGQMVSAGLIDEWNVTIAPLLASGQSKRVAVGPIPEGPPPGMMLSRVWLDDHYLFCRWVRPQ